MYADKTPAAYGGRAIISEQMSILGLENVFGHMAKRYFEPSVEEIIATNPKRIIALYTAGQSMLVNASAVVQNLRDRPALAGVDAIRNGAIIPLNYNYSSPSPGLEQLANQQFDVLGRRRATEQHQQVEKVEEDQVKQTQRHSARSCPKS